MEYPAATAAVLDLAKTILKDSSYRSILVVGHTDSVGTDEYNQNLSEHRAEAVRDYLVQQGIAANSIGARGLGKTQPIASNETPEGRQQNRRVELVLSGEAIGNATSASAGGAQQ